MWLGARQIIYVPAHTHMIAGSSALVVVCEVSTTRHSIHTTEVNHMVSCEAGCCDDLKFWRHVQGSPNTRVSDDAIRDLLSHRFSRLLGFHVHTNLRHFAPRFRLLIHNIFQFTDKWRKAFESNKRKVKLHDRITNESECHQAVAKSPQNVSYTKSIRWTRTRKRNTFPLDLVCYSRLTLNHVFWYWDKFTRQTTGKGKAKCVALYLPFKGFFEWQFRTETTL